MGNKQEVFEVLVQIKNDRAIGLTEMWRDTSRAWNMGMGGNLFRKDRQGIGGGIALCIKAMYLCSEVQDKVESRPPGKGQRGKHQGGCHGGCLLQDTKPKESAFQHAITGASKCSLLPKENNCW